MDSYTSINFHQIRHTDKTRDEDGKKIQTRQGNETTVVTAPNRLACTEAEEV